MFAAQLKLSNLINIVDYNQYCIGGSINRTVELEPFAAKWRSFGWHVVEINGHNMREICDALDYVDVLPGKPKCIVAHTVQREVWMIAPTGPVPQWVILAKNLNRIGQLLDRFSLEHVHVVMMDDYADPQGRTPSLDTVGSFQHTIRVNFWDQLDAEIRMPWDQIIFPTEELVEQIPHIILTGDGVIDVVYGGIGWGLHFAFVDREAFTSNRWAHHDLEQWKRLRVLKAIELDASTIYQNALHTWGSNQWAVPGHANTVGPALILGDEAIRVKYRSFWCDGLCAGPEMTWQAMAVHTALYAPPDPELPATFLKTLPGEVNVMTPLNEPISVVPR